MSQEINKAEKQDLSLVVQAIGTDLEHTQVRVVASANADMLFHYWKVGHFILYLQKKEGWGSKVIDNLSKAIRSKYPDKKGYSRRNIFYMCQFASAYPLEVLKEMDRIDSLLTTPTVEKVLSLTNELNQRGCVKMYTSSFLCTKPRLSQARALLFPKVFVPLGIKKISL